MFRKTGVGYSTERLPTRADAIFEDGRAVFIDGHLELCRPRSGFGEFVGGGEHFPIATDGLIHFDGDRSLLVIA
jgi:hypothetical protein